jgi:serine/threonine protein kinase
VLNQVMREGRHPGIIPLQHSYLSGELPCLAYEYVAGGDLTGVIRQMHAQAKKSMEVVIEQATAIMEKLADIIAYAHQRKPPIVHRDLKPANVLVQRVADGGFKPRIADFGIGAVVATQNILQTTRTGPGQYRHSIVRGAYTPLYASPQQMRGGPPDPRDDVHALGVIWYQMLTGDLGKGCPGGSAWARKLKEQGMKKGLIDLLTACFEEDPADRPADAGEVLEQLRGAAKSRSARKATLQLNETEARTFERFAAAKTIQEEARDEMDRQKEAAQEMLWRKMLQLWHKERAKPENPTIKVPGGHATGVAQIKEVLKVDLPADSDLTSALLAAGFSRECAERVASSEVQAETELALRSPSELARSNPELLAKIKGVLQQHLTPAEQEEAFVKTVTSKVRKGFLERASDYACTEEELCRLFEVIRPQFSFTGVTYKGDLEKMFREIHGQKDHVTVKGAEAT